MNPIRKLANTIADFLSKANVEENERMIRVLRSRLDTHKKVYSYHVVYFFEGKLSSWATIFIERSAPIRTARDVDSVREFLIAGSLGASLDPGDALVIINWKELELS